MHEQLSHQLIAPELSIPGVNKNPTTSESTLFSQRSVVEMPFPEIAEVELTRLNPYVVVANLRPLLDAHHSHWREELKEVSRQQRVAVIEPGFDDTSMAEHDDEPTRYRPSGQKLIKERFPWIHELFKKGISIVAKKLMNDPSMYLGNGEAALSMNAIEEGGYELHIDNSPLTALLGITDVYEHQGGELLLHEGKDEFNRPYGKQFRIKPEAGIVYFFRGDIHPHEVTHYSGTEPRIVIPAAIYSKNNPEVINPKFNKGIGV